MTNRTSWFSTLSHNVAGLLLFLPHQPHTAAAAFVGGDGMVEKAVAEIDAQGLLGVQAR